jgi:hypothetical protein
MHDAEVLHIVVVAHGLVAQRTSSRHRGDRSGAAIGGAPGWLSPVERYGRAMR